MTNNITKIFSEQFYYLLRFQGLLDPFFKSGGNEKYLNGLTHQKSYSEFNQIFMLM